MVGRDREEIGRRISERDNAYNALAREKGTAWQLGMGEKRRQLVSEGRASIKELLDRPQNAALLAGLSVGLAGVRELTNRYFARNHEGERFWSAEDCEPPTVASLDPTSLTRTVKALATMTGAALVGVTTLDPRWIYEEVGRSHSDTDELTFKPVQVDQAPHAVETDEAVYLSERLDRIVVLGVPMDREMILTAPGILGEAATGLGYSLAAGCSLSVVLALRSMGFQAIPSLNDTGLTIPMAVQAGLGELGRNGLLLTADYGPCVRLAKVFTNAPLLLDTPVQLGYEAYCGVCRECAHCCPAQAIADGEPTPVGIDTGDERSVRKWPVDAKRCLRYWVASGTSCSVCIARCPLTLGRAWMWGLPQRVMRRTALLNRALTALDRLTRDRKSRRTSRVAQERFV